MKLLLSILSLILVLELSSCDIFKKTDPKPLTELQKLPAATQTGKNTMGCLINGTAFVPSTSVDVVAVYQQGILQMSGHTYGPSRGIEIVIYEKNYGPLTTISYPLNKYPDSWSQITYQTGTTSTCDTTAFVGNVILTNIDRVNYIVSGTFEFTSVPKGCDTLKVIDGRFDIKYIP